MPHILACICIRLCIPYFVLVHTKLPFSLNAIFFKLYTRYKNLVSSKNYTFPTKCKMEPTNEDHYLTKWNLFSYKIQFVFAQDPQGPLPTTEMRCQNFSCSLTWLRKRISLCGIWNFVREGCLLLVGFVGNLWATNYILWDIDFRLCER